MPWFKVDDKLHSHKKVAKAGEAMALWVVAGSWCSDQLTDGFVPDYMAVRLVPGGEKMAAALVEAGLWVEGEHDGDDGWWFHDWEDNNPTSDEVEAKREAARERMRRVRGNRSARSQDVRANSKRSAPNPEPDPEPKVKNVAASADADAPDEIDQQFEDHFWPAYPKTNGRKPEKAKALQRWRKLSVQDRRDALRGAINRAKHVEATGEQPPYAQRYLRDRKWEDDQAPVKVDPEVAGPRRLPDVDDEVEQDDRPAWKDESGQWHGGGAA